MKYVRRQHKRKRVRGGEMVEKVFFPASKSSLIRKFSNRASVANLITLSTGRML